MRIVRIINDANIPDNDFNILLTAVTKFAVDFTKAWDISDILVVGGGEPQFGDWLVYATEKNRHIGAAGYHTIQGGFPISYCSPKASGRLFGTYIKPLVIKGKTIHGAIYSGGLVTTICHEVAEMIIDPVIKTLSPIDFKGRSWLVEVCDHVFGSFNVITINGKNCVLPDATLPSFYERDGVAPYSLFNAVTAPFVMTAKGYGYYMNGNKLVKL